jgi:Peptidase A4 family
MGRRSSKPGQLPVESVETNIEGVYSFVPPPRGVNLISASRPTLLKHGIFFPPPDSESEPRRFALWERFVWEIWTEDNFVVPVFEPSKALPHILKGPVQQISPNNTTSTNWGGVAIRSTNQYNWAGAMGVWNVPTVTAPEWQGAEPAPNDQEYHSASWVGLGGAWKGQPGASLALLQAGVAHDVVPGITTEDMPGGIGRYSAWAEWFTPAYYFPLDRIKYKYLAPQTISNMLVEPGDQISVIIQYVQHRGDAIANPAPQPGPYTFGAVLIVDMTTGSAANFYWPPPPVPPDLGIGSQASFSRDSAEWIVELNDGTALAAFSTLEFTDAGACNAFDAPPGGIAGTELQNGTIFDLKDGSNHIVTATMSAEGSVRIQYVPPP